MMLKRELRSGIRRARGPVGVSLAAGFWAQAVLALTGTIAARLLGPEDRGYLALLLLLPPTLSQLGSLGVPLALTYYIAQDESRARPLLRSVLSLAVWQLSGMLAINGVIVLLVVAFGHSDLVPAALLGLASLPGWVALLYGLAILQGRQLFVPFNICRMLPVTLYLGLLVPLFLVSGDRLPEVVAAWVGGHTLAGVVTAWLGIRSMPARQASSALPDRRDLLRFGTRSLVGSISPIETLRVDQALVGYMLGAAALGYYVVALAFTNLPKYIAQSFGFVAYPRVSAALARGESGRAAGARLLAMSILLAAPVALLLFAFAGILVRGLFGDDFDGAVTPMRILLGGAMLMSVRRVLAECARGAGHGALDSIAEATLWVIFLPGCFVVNDRFGLSGVASVLAVAAAASLLTLAVLFWFRANRAVPTLNHGARADRPVSESVQP